ncbi:NADH-quinone oxidoreductase subunit J [Kordiimonas lipolytica]|uniref:NADH-quinone oxidoreductase subunit J n=1 Tax=Kordiimonas lipolytica TaxID=1662421 RepID=A0ABV8U993_9PROT|nr:NADH-quinone oxidoreductase subunit J [Kordiimonas lipolytica]
MDFSSMLPVAAFWLFAGITILSGLLVILAKNPVHSVLWLILAFFSAAGLFVLMGAEFLAMLLVIVYVGAVAVLFLFVVMMLDINFVELRQGIMQNAPIGVVVGLVLLVELGTLGATWHFGEDVGKNAAAPMPVAEQVENTAALGNVIYTDYIFIFQMSGLILLVAMIGAIVLTHRTRPGVRRQNVSKQNARRPEEAYELVDVEVGKGVALPTKKG